MIVRELRPGIHALMAIDWHRKLFDELVPLPEGTSYNAYVVVGSEKTALIDTVHPSMTAGFMAALRSLGLKTIDYIVSNHAEPDHAGSIAAVLAEYPQARVLANVKCRSLLVAGQGIKPEAVTLIKDQQTVSLGDRTLRFMWVPWVHWPDTTFTYVEQDRVLFSCDFLGAHLATSALYADDEARVERAARMYYAEIMMPYREHVRKYTDQLLALPIDLIAPSHGPVHRRPPFILQLYRDWASNEVRPKVVIPYLSMYESTTRMVEHLIDQLMARGIAVQPFNVVDLDSGRFAAELVDASTLVFGSPTVLDGPHPAMASAAYLTNALKPKARFGGIIGSYGWGNDAMQISLAQMLPNLAVQWFAPVVAGGLPRAESLAALDQLAGQIALAHAGLLS